MSHAATTSAALPPAIADAVDTAVSAAIDWIAVNHNPVCVSRQGCDGIDCDGSDHHHGGGCDCVDAHLDFGDWDSEWFSHNRALQSALRGADEATRKNAWEAFHGLFGAALQDLRGDL